MAHIFNEENYHNIDLEIKTLLHAGQSNYDYDTVHSVITPQVHNASDQPWKVRNVSKVHPIEDGSSLYPWWIKEKSHVRSSESESSFESFDDKLECVTVNGADIGDLPIEYNVEGLKMSEFPVIGTYVDRRILPGFKYRIRLLGSKKYLFKGQALAVLSIGMGYGKRITMEGESHNVNSNYFYSDTHPNGYGFEPVGISHGEKFVVCDKEERPIGKATIEYVDCHNELKTVAKKETGEIQKHMTVSFVCSLVYGSEPHGLMPLCSSNSVQMNGLLCLNRPKRNSKAYISTFTELELPHYGMCTFEKCNVL